MSASPELFDAIRAGDPDRVRGLLADDPERASARDAQGVSAIMTALYHRHPDIAEDLAERVPALDIFEAAALGRTAEVERLLDAEAGLVSARSPDGFTALHYPAFFGHPETLAALLARGADAAAVADNPMRVQPLHSAASQGSAESVRFLLEAGAPADAAQDKGWTALHAAAMHARVELVELLLHHGADPRTANDDGASAIDLAREAGHPAILARLERAK